MKRKRALLSLPVLAGVAALSALGFGSLSIDASTREAMAAVLKDPLAVLALRSPGERLGGALLMSKGHSRSAARHAGGKPNFTAPTERVLANVRQRPPAEEPGNVAGLLGTPPGDEPLFGPTSSPQGLEGDTPPPFQTNPVWSPGFSTPVNDGGDTPPGPPEPPPAVPEPSTWATMIIGFFAIGLSLRRRAGRAPASGSTQAG